MHSAGSGQARAGTALFRTKVASAPSRVTHDLCDLTGGFWAVVITFEGAVTAVRFDDVADRQPTPRAAPWTPLRGAWDSSLTEARFLAGVREIRDRIAAGTVYQVNLCRVLSHPLGADADLAGLAAALERGNPAPYSALIQVPDAGLDLVCASPEAYLIREGERITTRPIKGTAAPGEDFLEKDYPENVMIVDLMRHDLSPVCEVGSIRVDALCAREEHPGLAHLVSDISGTLRPGVGWSDIVGATFPPGSVSGAPKHTALQAIADLEPVPRGPYCGAIGWIDADNDRAELAVGIRTFWAEATADGRRLLKFGTGAGITWGSDAEVEWAETQLKASRLIGLAGNGAAHLPELDHERDSGLG